MTIPSATRMVTYDGDGTDSSFDFPFKIFAKSNLVVYVQDSDGVQTSLSLTTNYTIPDEDVNEVNGGTITLVADSTAAWQTAGCLATGYTIVLQRTLPLTQTTNLSTWSTTPPSTIEATLDKIVGIAQQQQAVLDRSIRVPDTDTPAAGDLVLPPATERANTIAAYDSNGKPTTAVLSTVGADAAASFVTISAEASLTNERRLAGTSNQTTVTDNGAGSTVQVGIATNPVLPGNASTTGTLTVATGETITSGNLTMSAGHQSVTDSHATTTPTADLIQASTGDAGVRVNLSGGTSYILGIDNSDSDYLKISKGTAGNAVLGTNDILVTNGSGVFIGNFTTGLSNFPVAGLLNLRRSAAGSGAPWSVEFNLVDTNDSNNISGTNFIEGAVLTTDATQTTLASFAAISNTATVVEATVTAFRTGGSSGSAADSAGYKLWAIYKNNAGTLTQVGSTTQTVLGESQAGWDATLDASSNSMRVRVTGAANNNVRWVAHITVTTTTIRIDS